MQQAEFERAVAALMQDYIRGLDRRAFDDWLGLFDAEGYYAVLRDIEYQDGNNVLLVGENMRRLSGRIESGKTRDTRRMMHVICWQEANAAAATAVVGFMVWLDGTPSTCGRYELDLVEIDGALKIRTCTTVIDTIDIRDTIYLPI